MGQFEKDADSMERGEQSPSAVSSWPTQSSSNDILSKRDCEADQISETIEPNTPKSSFWKDLVGWCGIESTATQQSACKDVSEKGDPPLNGQNLDDEDGNDEDDGDQEDEKEDSTLIVRSRMA